MNLNTLYSMSIKPSRAWNGDKLGLLAADANTYLTNFFENKNTAVILSYDSNLDAQHLFKPNLYDRILPTDEVETASTVVGNAVNDLGTLMPMKTDKSVLHHVPVVMLREEAHEICKDRNALPKAYLKGTVWEDAEGEMIAFPITASIVLPFGTKPPVGNLTDPEYQRECKVLGGEYEFHALAMHQCIKYQDDIRKVMDKMVKAKTTQNYFCKGYGVDYLVYKDRYPIQMSLLRDENECPGAMDDLKTVFGIKKAPASDAASKPANEAPTNQTPNYVIAKPEDEEKKKADEMGYQRLSIFFASCPDLRLERGVTNFQDGMSPPVWTPGFEEIMDMKGDSAKALGLQDLQESTFQAVTSGIDIYQEKSSIDAASSLFYFPKNGAAQLLKGNFCTEVMTSEMREKVSITLGLWLYQENVDNKIMLLKEKETRNQVENQYDLPDSQKSEVESTIVMPGSLVTFEHSVGLIANAVRSWASIAKQGFKAGDLMPVILSCFIAIFYCLTEAQRVRWAKEHSETSPFFPIWIFNQVQAIFLCGAKATKQATNMSLVRQNRFKDIDRTYFNMMVRITLNTIDKLEEWSISGNGCDIIPKGVPLALNPAAQEAKKQQEKIEALIKAAESKKNSSGGDGKRRRNNDSTITPVNANASNAGSEESKEDGGKSKDKAAKGSFVANPEKELSVAALFANIGLEERHCFNFHMVGKECKQHRCSNRHHPLSKMPEGDRKKLLEHIADTKIVFLNPKLKSNAKLMGMLTDEQKKVLFPQADDETSGASN